MGTRDGTDARLCTVAGTYGHRAQGDPTSVPDHVPPMLATASRVADLRDGFAYELKWDGVRASVATDGRRVVVRSRRGGDISSRYPELQAIGTALGRRVLLDGEIVAFGEGPRPSFSRLQRRMHLQDPARVAAASRAVPVVFLAFDLLVVGERSMLDVAYEERRAGMDELRLHGPHWQTPPSYHEDLATMLRVVEDLGLEGLVAKRPGSVYRPGTRSDDWRKLRLLRRQEFVVGGYRHGRGGRRGSIGSLLVGWYDPDGDLRYAGNVGSGLSGAEIDRLAGLLAPHVRASSPFADRLPPQDATFVDPTVVVEVAFSEWTPDGHLRQPTYRGRRDDKDPREVGRDA